MSPPDPAITPEVLDSWLMGLPMKERKLKQQRIIDKLRVSKRTVENWRGGRPIPPKHFAELREIMGGGDKVSVDFEPHVHEALMKKASELGYKSVSDYLTALVKFFVLTVLFLHGVDCW